MSHVVRTLNWNDDVRYSPGYTLFSQERETHLIDAEGRKIRSWKAQRNVFCAHLLENGDLLRDGRQAHDAISTAPKVRLVELDTKICVYGTCDSALALSSHAFSWGPCRSFNHPTSDAMSCRFTTTSFYA